MKVIYQALRRTTYQGKRLYVDMMKLAEVGFTPGEQFDTKITDNEITLSLDEKGKNRVSRKSRGGRIIPVIDKVGKEIQAALTGCAHIILSIVEENGEYRVIIKGEKTTKQVKSTNERKKRQLTSLTFCSGAGITSEAMKEAGFNEVAAVEWNPKEGRENKFSDLYEQNHPESIMFNVPLELLKGNHLPYADVWLATLDCIDFSKSTNGTKKQLHTLHLFMHLMRLFWEREKEQRPEAIFIENVPEFEKVAGNALKLALQEEGYEVNMAQINSLDYGSRTKRRRFFMVATIKGGFTFPEPTGQISTPMIGEIRLDELEWVTPEQDKTLSHFLKRQECAMSHNHKLTSFDITKDSYIGTITKSHFKKQPENWLRHPTNENTYAYLKADQIRVLQGIPKHLNIGDSNKMQVESMGQSVCYKTFLVIAKKLYNFLLGYPSTLKKYEQLSLFG